MDATELRREIVSFLSAYHVMSLATCADDGAAHAASLFYAIDGLALVWTSDAAARHSRHLESRPQVAATLAPDCDDFMAVRGLQIAGSARRLHAEADVACASQAMRRRYPFLDALATAPQALRMAHAQAGYYRLEPERITLIDNTRGFGHKESLRILADGTLAAAAS
jgi:uncharacterized protein YhbP (UPF0306 family)